MLDTGFKVDKEKCVHCGKCELVCPPQLISYNEKKEPEVKPVEQYGWDGCWRCQHCMAVCPVGAISIFGLDPEGSIKKPNMDDTKTVIDALMTNRRTCRRYTDKKVDEAMIRDMLDVLACAPNGGNKMQVEYTLITDEKKMEQLRSMIQEKANRDKAVGIYPDTFDQESYQQMVDWQEKARPDMFLCGATNLLIPHVEKGHGCWQQDANIAAAYFELLCASRGLGCSMMTFPLDVIDGDEAIMEFLEIPNEHYIPMMIGFGYPEIVYARGIQRKAKINLLLS